MTTHYNSFDYKSDRKLKKPLKLVAGDSPKTSVFEKQLGHVHTANATTFVFTSHKSPRRTIGGYNPPVQESESSTISRMTPPASPQKSPSRWPARGFQSPGDMEYTAAKEVCVKIPLHRVRSMFRSVSSFFDTLTKEDFDRAADFLSYSSVGGFSVFGETLLHSNRQGFLILVPIVLVSVLKIVSKSQDNILVATSIRKSLSGKRISARDQRLVCQVIIFLKTLLLMLATKITASFKLQLDYTSHLEIFILLMLGSLIVCVFISLFHNVTSIWLLGDNNRFASMSLGAVDYDQDKDSSRYQHSNGDSSPLYEDYCVLDTPESE